MLWSIVRPTNALPSSPSATCATGLPETDPPVPMLCNVAQVSIAFPWLAQPAQPREINCEFIVGLWKNLPCCYRLLLMGGILKTKKPPPPPPQNNNNNKTRKTQQQKTRSNNNNKTVLLAVFCAFNLCWCSLIPSWQLWRTSWLGGGHASRARPPVSDGGWQWCCRWHR